MNLNDVSKMALLRPSANINRAYAFAACGSAIVLLLAACGKAGIGGPSDADARATYPAYAGMDAPIDFQKTNGESLTKDGQKLYVYHLQQANPLKGARWYDCAIGRIFTPEIIDPGLAYRCTALPGSAANGLVVSKGTITFKETEKGWVAAERTISSWGYCASKEKLADCYSNAMTTTREPW